MPTNSMQKVILNETFNFYIEMIRESRPDVARYALKAIFEEEIYQNQKIKAALQEHDILSVVDFFRRIVNHPCPQNRAGS